MRLIIDIGNSRLKAAVEANGILTLLPAWPWRGEDLAAYWARAFAAGPTPGAVLVSNVAGSAVAEAVTAASRAHWALTPQFMHVRTCCAGMRTSYDDPTRLGVDRWLAALAGFHLAEGPVCVIDAGTALTVDVVTAQGEHRGGLIAPGLALMARSLTQGTAQLSIDTLAPVTRFATNTRDAISLGCRDAVAGLLERVALRWTREFAEPVRYLVTGGEAAELQALSPFALELVPDLVHRGILIAADAQA